VAAVEGELQRAFGRNLRQLREQRGLSQEGMADVLDVHRTFVGGVERGERNLTLQTVERLSARLGADPVVLLGAPAPATGLRAAASGKDPGPARGNRRRPRP
jgi:transcriptional regulator with XRE-family HTH domain